MDYVTQNSQKNAQNCDQAFTSRVTKATQEGNTLNRGQIHTIQENPNRKSSQGSKPQNLTTSRNSSKKNNIYQPGAINHLRQNVQHPAQYQTQFSNQLNNASAKNKNSTQPIDTNRRKSSGANIGQRKDFVQENKKIAQLQFQQVMSGFSQVGNMIQNKSMSQLSQIMASNRGSQKNLQICQNNLKQNYQKQIVKECKSSAVVVAPVQTLKNQGQYQIKTPRAQLIQNRDSNDHRCQNDKSPKSSAFSFYNPFQANSNTKSNNIVHPNYLQKTILNSQAIKNGNQSTTISNISAGGVQQNNNKNIKQSYEKNQKATLQTQRELLRVFQTNEKQQQQNCNMDLQQEQKNNFNNTQKVNHKQTKLEFNNNLHPKQNYQNNCKDNLKQQTNARQNTQFVNTTQINNKQINLKNYGQYIISQVSLPSQRFQMQEQCQSQNLIQQKNDSAAPQKSHKNIAVENLTFASSSRNGLFSNETKKASLIGSLIYNCDQKVLTEESVRDQLQLQQPLLLGVPRNNKGTNDVQNLLINSNQQKAQDSNSGALAALDTNGKPSENESINMQNNNHGSNQKSNNSRNNDEVVPKERIANQKSFQLIELKKQESKQNSQKKRTLDKENITLTLQVQEQAITNRTINNQNLVHSAQALISPKSLTIQQQIQQHQLALNKIKSKQQNADSDNNVLLEYVKPLKVDSVNDEDPYQQKQMIQNHDDACRVAAEPATAILQDKINGQNIQRGPTIQISNQQNILVNNQQQLQVQQAQQHPVQQNTESGHNNGGENQLNDTMIFSSKSSLDEYIIGKQIGQGAYAIVRIGLHKPTNQKVAMKIYKKYKLEEPNRRKSVKREIKLMEKMKHFHIIQLYEIIDTSKYVILVMEYVGGGSLHGYLKSKKDRRLEEWDAKKLFYQLVDGLKYCHSKCITHRDIKLENLLLDDQNNMKIIDFGFSTCIPNDKKIKIFCGTPSYMAPEIVLKTEYCGPPADIWALGVLLFTILTGQFPYRGATDEELYGKICKADYNIPQNVKDSLSIEVIDLLAKLFSINPDERPTARDILKHSWFQKSNEKTGQSEDLKQLSMKRAKSQRVDTINTAQHQQNQGLKIIQPAKVQEMAPVSDPKYFNPFKEQDAEYINIIQNQGNPSNQSQENSNLKGQVGKIENQLHIQVYPQEQVARSSSHIVSDKHQFLTQKHDNRKKINFQVEQPEEIFNNKVIQIITEKLGYKQDFILKNLEDKNEFFVNLYERLLDREENDMLENELIQKKYNQHNELVNKYNLQQQQNIASQSSQGQSPFSGSQCYGIYNANQNIPIQPSFVPSVKSLTSANGPNGSISQIKLSNNLGRSNFNNTQPLQLQKFNTAYNNDNTHENLKEAMHLGQEMRNNFNASSSPRFGASNQPTNAQRNQKQPIKHPNFFSGGNLNIQSLSTPQDMSTYNGLSQENVMQLGVRHTQGAMVNNFFNNTGPVTTACTRDDMQIQKPSAAQYSSTLDQFHQQLHQINQNSGMTRVTGSSQNVPSNYNGFHKQ